MRYAIWHTPRTGSNVLCDCIIKTKLGGMRRLNDAGFFIGFGEEVKKAYAEGAVDRYFERNRTKNGVEGCKLGWDYVEHLNKWLAFGEVDEILLSFDAHILITRGDMVAQAVSRLVARQDGKWTSKDKGNDVQPVYNRERVTYFIAQMAGHTRSIQEWLALHDKDYLHLTYEGNALDWNFATRGVLEWVGVEREIPRVKPTLKKQSSEGKQRWIERYKRGE